MLPLRRKESFQERLSQTEKCQSGWRGRGFKLIGVGSGGLDLTGCSKNGLKSHESLTKGIFQEFCNIYEALHKTSEAEFPEEKEIKGKEEVKPCDKDGRVTTEKEKGSQPEVDVQVKREVLDPSAESEEQFVTISQLRSASMIKVRVTLEEKEIPAIVDTAAQVTIVSDKIFEKLNWKGPVLKKVVLQTAGRQLK